MQDSSSVITQATKGIVDDLREEMEVKQGRIYEILGRDNPYPKAKRLIRAIGRRDESPDKWRVRLIKADLDAMFSDVLSNIVREVGSAELHSELSEAIQAKLDGKPRDICLKEFREAKAVLDIAIQALEKVEIKEQVFAGVN